MYCKKLLIVGILAVALGMGGSAFAQCSANLADGLAPTGGQFNLGDTIGYQITLQVPASSPPPAFPNCTLTDVTVYFFPPGTLAPGQSPCENIGLGTIVASGLTLVAGDPIVLLTGDDDPVLDYLVEEADCDENLIPLANMAVTFFIEGGGDLQCDEKEAVNTIPPVDPPVCGIEGPLEICDDVAEAVYSSVDTADTYLWIVTGDGVIDGLDSLPSVTVNPTGPAGFNVELTVCNDNGTLEGCCNTCDEDVTVVATPECGIEGPTTVCEEDENILYSSANPAESYSWSVTGLGGVIVGPADGDSVLVDATGLGDFTVHLEVCNGDTVDCCDDCDLPVTVVEAPECLIEGPETVCEDDVEIVYNSIGGPADTHLWTVSGDGVIVGPDDGPSVTVSPTGTGFYTVELVVCHTNGFECCADCDLLVDVIEIPGGPEGPPIEGPESVCSGTLGIEYCTTVIADHYLWDIIGDGAIVGPIDEDCVTVNAGPSGSYTLTLEVCNDSEIGPCCNDNELEVTVDDCGVFCSFTQGFWGNAGGRKCDGKTTAEMIDGCVPFTVGMPGRSITFNLSECVIEKLPTGGKPRALPADLGDADCESLTSASGILKKGNKKGQRINNVLVGQVVALTLNLCVSDDCLGDDSGDLGGWVLLDKFCVVPFDDPEACPKQYTIPGSLVGKTVQELLDAANAALAGDTTYSISDIYTAVTAINEGFDECAELVECTTEEICENGCDDDFDGDVDEDECVGDD